MPGGPEMKSSVICQTRQGQDRLPEFGRDRKEPGAELQEICHALLELRSDLAAGGAGSRLSGALVQIAQRLEQIAERVDSPTYGASPDRPDAPELSPREREVLGWIALGKSNAVIGEILGISRHTVDTHNRRIFRKLDTADRTTAAIRAVEYGLV